MEPATGPTGPVGKSGRDEEGSRIAKYFKYSHLGLQFLLAVGLPVALGLWLDRRWGTKALFTLLGLALGFTAGVYSIYGDLFGRQRKKPDDGDGPGGRPPAAGPGGSA